MTSFQLGFHQDEDVLLGGNIVKTPPRSVGHCASGAQEMGERWIAGVCGGLHGVWGGRKADRFGLNSRKRFLRLEFFCSRLENILSTFLLSAWPQLAV